MNFLLPTLLLILITHTSARRDEFAAIKDLVNQANSGWEAALPSFLDLDDDTALSRMAGTLDFTVDYSAMATAAAARPRLLAGAPTSGTTTTTTTNSTSPATTGTTTTGNSAGRDANGNLYSMDLRTLYPQCKSLTLIRNQGTCGSCWVVSATTSLSDRYCIAKNINRSFASQDVMECCANCTLSTPSRNPCQGGIMPFAFKFAVESGITTGEDFGDTDGCKPYSINPSLYHAVFTSTCSATCTNSRFRTVLTANNRVKASSFAMGTGEAGIISALNRGGTVVGQMAVFSDLYLYKSGIYRHLAGPQVGGHGVRIIGYGVENGAKYWLIANSWGAAWGDKGFFKMSRGTNECGIEQNTFAYGVFN